MRHRCGGEVFINLSGSIAIAGDIDIGSDKYLTIRALFLAEKRPDLIEITKDTEFYCDKCDKSVDIEDIMAYCSFCNVIKSVSELKTYKKNSGIYCDDCIKGNDLKSSDLVPVINSFRFIKFN
jgi:hypothetical protein